MPVNGRKISGLDVLRSIPRRTVDVEIPTHVNSDGEWEYALFRLQEMSGTDRDLFEMAAFKERPDGKRTIESLYLRARLVASCLVDENGNRCLSTFDDESIAELSSSVSSAALGKLFDAAQKLNGLDAAATETAGKNSESVPAVVSTSP